MIPHRTICALALVLCPLLAAASEDVARPVVITGRVCLSDGRLTLQSEGYTYELAFESDKLWQDAVKLAGSLVEVHGSVSAEQNVSDTELKLEGRKLSLIARNPDTYVAISNRGYLVREWEFSDMREDSLDAPLGAIPERVLEKPFDWHHDDSFDEPFRGPEHESLAPQININW